MATLERMVLHVCPFNGIGIGDGHELDSYMNVLVSVLSAWQKFNVRQRDSR